MAAWAQTFIISDIRVEGLQRISAGSVFSAMPLAVGDMVDENGIRAASRSLFATGNFDDIRIGRDGNVLVIIVAERPSISEINIEGNKAIETEALLEGQRLTDELLEQAASVASSECCPVTDIRSTEIYRRQITGVYVKRTARQIMDRRPA